MKRYSLTVFLGLTVTLLALAPQLRADGTDHNHSDHGFALEHAKSFDNDSDMKHADTWRSDSDWDTAKRMCSGSHAEGDSDHHGEHHKHGKGNGGSGDSGSGNSGSGSSGSGSGSSSGSGSTVATVPEPSSLSLMLSALMAGMVLLALKRATA